mmetsp:Transcript_4414/g.9663  ORF Transcript_4414/g.9663 Transcript_4414/m.9663 type:complete len:234 (-) Transcript_4414:1117-1818(-)
MQLVIFAELGHDLFCFLHSFVVCEKVVEQLCNLACTGDLVGAQFVVCKLAWGHYREPAGRGDLGFAVVGDLLGSGVEDVVEGLPARHNSLIGTLSVVEEGGVVEKDVNRPVVRRAQHISVAVVGLLEHGQRFVELLQVTKNHGEVVDRGEGRYVETSKGLYPPLHDSLVGGLRLLQLLVALLGRRQVIERVEGPRVTVTIDASARVVRLSDVRLGDVELLACHVDASQVITSH